MIAQKLAQMLSLQYPEAFSSLTLRILVNTPTKVLRKCVASQDALLLVLQQLGLEAHASPVLWPWLARLVLGYLSPVELSHVCVTCRSWEEQIQSSVMTRISKRACSLGLIRFASPSANVSNANEVTNRSRYKTSIFAQAVLQGGLSKQQRAAFWQHWLQPAVRGANSLLVRAHDDRVRLEQRYQAARNVIMLIMSESEESDGQPSAEMIALESATKAIDDDVRRTFGHHARHLTLHGEFAHSTGTSEKLNLDSCKARLRRVLQTSAAQDLQLGYCQGMDSLALHLLRMTGWHEATAFWLFHLLIEYRDLRSVYCAGMPKLRELFLCLGKLVELKLPLLAVHFASLDIDVSMFVWPWFQTLWTDGSVFPPRITTAILDNFVFDGWKTVLSLTLALLAQEEQLLLTMDFEGTLKRLQNIGSTYSRSNEEPEPRQWSFRYLLEQSQAMNVTQDLLDDLRGDLGKSELRSRSAARYEPPSPSVPLAGLWHVT